MAAVDTALGGRLVLADHIRPPRPRYRCELTCLHCSRTAGDLEWAAIGSPAGGIIQLVGGAVRSVQLPARLSCPHCGGRLLAGEAERVRDPLPTALPKARRGRPRHLPVPEAS